MVGHMRTGTTWLCSILDNHPDIDCRQEILHSKRYRGSVASAYKYVSSTLNDSAKKLVGFKLLYHQFRGPDTADTQIFRFLINDIYKAKIIHIIRDKLEVFVSLQLSKRAKLWNVFKSNGTVSVISASTRFSDQPTIDLNHALEIYNTPIKLDIELASQFLYRYERWMLLISEMFPNRIDINYADLPDVVRVYEYLNVPKAEPTFATEKLLSIPYDQIVVNYDEIKRLLG